MVKVCGSWPLGCGGGCGSWVFGLGNRFVDRWVWVMVVVVVMGE